MFDLEANYISKLRKTIPFTCSYYEISNLFLAVKITPKMAKILFKFKNSLFYVIHYLHVVENCIFKISYLHCRYDEHNKIRSNTQNNGMTNSNIMRAHEAETRFPLGMRYGNAVYGFSGDPSTSSYTRTTNEINSRHIESTKYILQSGISSTFENGHVPTFYQRRSADQVLWIRSPNMRNEFDVSTTSKRECHEQIKDNLHVRSSSESKPLTSGNQLLTDNTTMKSRIENQNQKRMVKTVKTILPKEDTSSSKEKSHV